MANTFETTSDSELLKHGRMIDGTFYPHSQFYKHNGLEILLKQTPVNFSPERLALKPLPNNIKPADPLLRETRCESDRHLAYFAWAVERKIKKIILCFDYLANKDQAAIRLAELIQNEIHSSFPEDPLLAFYGKFQACIFLPKDLREEVWGIIKKEYTSPASLFSSSDLWIHFSTPKHILSGSNYFTKLLSIMLLEDECPLNFVLSILSLQSINSVQALPGVTFNTKSGAISLEIEGSESFTILIPLDPEHSLNTLKNDFRPINSPALAKFISLCLPKTIQAAPKMDIDVKVFSESLLGLLTSNDKNLQHLGLQLLAHNRTHYALEIKEADIISALSQSEPEVFKKFMHLSATLSKLDIPDSIHDPVEVALFCIKALLGIDKDRIACNLWIANLNQNSFPLKEEYFALGSSVLERMPFDLVYATVVEFKKCARNDTVKFENLIHLITVLFQKHLENIPGQELLFQKFMDLVRILTEKIPSKPLEQEITKRLTALMGWSINQLILKKTHLVQAHELLMTGFAKDIFKKEHPKVLGLCKLLMRKSYESELSSHQKAQMWMDLYQKGIWDLYQQSEEPFKQFIEHAKAICNEKQNPITILHYQLIEVLLEQSLKKEVGAIFHDEIYDFIRRLGGLGQTEKTRALALYEKHKSHFAPSERIALHELILSDAYTPAEQYNDLLFLLSFASTAENREAAKRIYRSVLKGINKIQATDLILNLAKKMPEILDAAEIIDLLKEILPENKDKIVNILDLLLSEIFTQKKYTLEIHKSLFSLIDALKPIAQNLQNSLQKHMKAWIQEIQNQNNLHEGIRFAALHAAFLQQDAPYIKEYALGLLQKIAVEKMDLATCLEAVEYAKGVVNRLPRKQIPDLLFRHLMHQTFEHHLHDLSLECLILNETFQCSFENDGQSFACLNALLRHTIKNSNKEKVVFVLDLLTANFAESHPKELEKALEQALEIAADKHVLWVHLSNSFLSFKTKEISSSIRQQAEKILSKFAQARKPQINMEQAWKILVEFEIDDIEIWTAIIQTIVIGDFKHVDLVFKLIKNNLHLLKNLKKNLQFSKNLWLSIILCLDKCPDKEVYHILLKNLEILESICPRTEIKDNSDFAIYLGLIRGCILYFLDHASQTNYETILNTLLPLKNVLASIKEERHIVAARDIDLALLDLLTMHEDERMFSASLKLLLEIIETHQPLGELPVELQDMGPGQETTRLIETHSVKQIIMGPLKRLIRMWPKFIPPLDPVDGELNLDAEITPSSYLSLLLILTGGNTKNLSDDFEFIYDLTRIDNRSFDSVIPNLFFDGIVKLTRTLLSTGHQKILAQQGNSILSTLPYIIKHRGNESFTLLMHGNLILPAIFEHTDNTKLFEIIFDKILLEDCPKKIEAHSRMIETALKLFRLYLDKLPAGTPLNSNYCLIFASYCDWMLQRELNEETLAMHHAIYKGMIKRTDDLLFVQEVHNHPCVIMESNLFDVTQKSRSAVRVAMRVLLDEQKDLVSLPRYVPPTAPVSILQKMIFSPYYSVFGKRGFQIDKFMDIIRKNKAFAPESLAFDAFYFFVNKRFPKDTKYSQAEIIDKLFEHAETHLLISNGLLEFMTLLDANKKILLTNAVLFTKYLKIATRVLLEDYDQETYGVISRAALRYLFGSFHVFESDVNYKLNFEFDLETQFELLKKLVEFADKFLKKLNPAHETYIHLTFLLQKLQLVATNFPEIVLDILEITVNPLVVSHSYVLLKKMQTTSGSALEPKKLMVLDKLKKLIFGPDGHLLNLYIDHTLLDELMESAHKGNVVDQCNVARVSFRALQEETGLEWLKLAIAADYPWAFLIKGKWLYRGKKDWVQAVECLKKAGDIPGAWFGLYLIYSEGSEDVPVDLAAAEDYLAKCIKVNYPAAIIAKANSHCRIYQWDSALRLLESQTFPEAWVLKGDIYRSRSKSKEDELRASTMYKKASGEAIISQYRLACCYKFGVGVQRNDEEANLKLGLLRSSKDANELFKAYLYVKDSFIEEDKKFLLEILSNAALKGSPEALRHFAKYNQQIKNHPKAFEAWEMLAKHGDGEAFYELGNHMLNNKPSKPELAKEYYEKAANGNHVPAARKAREMLSKLTNNKI